MLKIADIIDYLEIISPKHLAEDGDRIGLQIGNINNNLTKIFTVVDCTRKVIEKAINEKAELIISHHPIIYDPIKSLTDDNTEISNIIQAVKAGISVYVIHTNFDSASGGINDALAEVLNIKNPRILYPRKSDILYKICVFTPHENVEAIRNAMAQKGAGVIGEYSYCSFRTMGIGSFMGSDLSNPTIGSKNTLEEIDECKLEMVCHKSKLDDVLRDMLKTHPYEEPAYDIIELCNSKEEYGFGRIGDLENELELQDFANMVQKCLNVEYIKVMGDKNKIIKKVAVCGGGGSSIYKSAISLGADVYVTGDVKYHDTQSALNYGLAVIDAGHFETERPGMINLSLRLKEEFSSYLDVSYIE